MMKRVAAFVLLFGFVASAQPKHVDQDLRKMLDQQTAAWNSGDLEAFMQGYWHSPDLTFYSGNTINHGWEETLQRYRQRYQSRGAQMGALNFTDEQIDMFGPDAAVVSARWHLSMPNGEKREGLTTIVCKRMKGGWKIVHDHSS